jgi:hypothetical protein
VVNGINLPSWNRTKHVSGYSRVPPLEGPGKRYSKSMAT